MKSTTKKHTIPNRERIMEVYMEELQNSGHPPVSVRRLCQDLDLSEKDFYREFTSLNMVEKHFWKDWMENLVTAVTSGKEWSAFSSKQRYLAFLFAFAGKALECRSLLEQRFGQLTYFCSPNSLEGLKNIFKIFISDLVNHGVDNGEIAPRGVVGSLYPEVLYIHWRSVLNYFLKDESHGFDRTDAFIEKTVEFAFDLLSTQAIDSAADLARFVLPQLAHFGDKN